MDESDEHHITNMKSRVFRGMEIGQFKVVGSNGLFVIPRQYYFTISTFTITAFPVLFQLFYVNQKFIEFKEIRKVGDLKDDSGRALSA